LRLGGGIRSIEKAKELIANGADYIIVGTAAVKDKAFLIALAKAIGKEKIIVSLDYKDKKVLTDGWDQTTAQSPIELGIQFQNYCSAFLVTCVDKEGKLNGPDIEYLTELQQKIKTPLIASGGISSLDDLRKLKKVGMFGTVIGMAIYKRNIDIKEALQTLS